MGVPTPEIELPPDPVIGAYKRDVDRALLRENLRLSAALAPFSPYLRGAPEGFPFHLDAETVRRGLNRTLTTTVGPIDLFGEIPGGGPYRELREPSSSICSASKCVVSTRVR